MKTEEARNLIEKQIDALGSALEKGHSEQLREFLGAMSRFHSYSLGNLLLIMAQRPDASHVAGFQTWKTLGRYVRAGEKGIAILAPIAVKDEMADPSSSTTPEGEKDQAVRFRVAHVFDITQTEGEPLPDFAHVTGDPGLHSERLRALVRQMNISLEYSDSLGSAFGVSQGGRILIQPGMDPAHEFTTLVHELAHEILHHGHGREGSTRRSRELEAEAVAFVVAQSIGLDSGTASSDYIQLYRGDKALLLSSLNAVRTVSATILAALQDKHPPEMSSSAAKVCLDRLPREDSHLCSKQRPPVRAGELCHIKRFPLAGWPKGR